VNGGKPITLSFWTQVDQEAIHRKLIQDYMAIHPNVRIELTAADFNDHFNKLKIALQSDMGPDIFHVHNSFEETLRPFMRPYPEEILPHAALEKDFRQALSHEADGEIYFIDTGLMTSAIYYNVDIWREAGLTERDLPRTWEELREIAKRLTVRDAAGKITRAGFNPNGIGMSLFTAMNLQQGQALFSDAARLKPVVDTAAARRSIAYLRALYRTDRSADVRLPEFHESFGMGSAAMIYGWGWTGNWLRMHYPECHFDVFRIPAWTASSPAVFDRNNGECSMGVAKSSPHANQAVAFDLIKFFLAKDEYLLELSSRFGVAPTKRSLDDHPALKDGKLFSAYRNMLDKTVWPGPLPDFYESILTDALIDPVVIDGVDSGRALADAQEKLTEAFAKNAASGH
jgi:multiple sugar transport system substrate-binding protein